MKNVSLRTVAVLVVAGLFAIAAFSQIRIGGPDGTAFMQDAFAGLKKALSLTDTQVSQLESLVQSQMAALQPLFAELMAKQEAVQTALQGGNATAIGNAMLALQSSQKALKTAQDGNLNALLDLLTPGQKQIVNDYLLIAQNGGPGPLGIFGEGPVGPGVRFLHIAGGPPAF
jgi:Spy/CpxP family protein refolding chaperone